MDAEQRLEQRIKQLEYEFKILKNEIQRTLLDIQEQILVHYYPALRAEEEAPAQEVQQAFESVREKRGTLGGEVRVAAPSSSGAMPAPAPLPVQSAPAPAMMSMPAAAPAAMPAAATMVAMPSPAPVMDTTPAVKKVSLEEVRRTREVPTGDMEMIGAPSPQAAAEATRGMDQASVVALSNWVTTSVAKIGTERTRKLIDVSAQRGFVANEIKDTLVRLAMLGGGMDPGEKVAVNEILNALLKLGELLGRGTNVEEALSVIEEAKLG
jgi:hypothetical protein